MKLTRADKNFLITKVLTETFKTKFYAWEIELKVRIQAEVYLKHPVFERLLKDKEIRPYLYITSPNYVHVNGGRPCMPDYESININTWMNFRGINVPQQMEIIRLEDPHYAELCHAYNEAYVTLNRMLNSYTTREKFLVDFPEYKDYLPVEEKVGLPAIIPATVRAELSKFGIPAK